MTSTNDQEILITAAETLRALAHPLRLSIVNLLHQQGPQSVTQIHLALDIEQAVASHHLRILKDKRIVGFKRDGKLAMYSLRDQKFYHLFDTVKSLTSSSHSHNHSQPAHH